MGKRKGTYVGRIYLGQDAEGKQLYHWVGRFDTKRERDEAVAEERVRLKQNNTNGPAMPTCEEYVDRYLAEYERTHKDSSFDTAKQRLQRFKDDFASRPLDSITRMEAKGWAAKVKPSCVPMVVTLFNHAIDEDDLPIERNPFRKLGKRGEGRGREKPPTAEEMDKLLGSCSALGWYAPQMRALVTFAAYSGMRPGEIFALEWGDIDFDAMRIHVRRRLYRGKVDIPKSNRVRTIALTAPARDALLTLPSRSDGGLVFLTKQGKRFAQPTLAWYWSQVLAGAGLDFDFYLATKHYCAHYLWVVLKLPERVVKEQLGHVDTKLLREVYGHGDVGALDEIVAAFEPKITELRKIEGGRAGEVAG